MGLELHGRFGLGFELHSGRLQRRRGVAAQALPEGGGNPDEARGGLDRLGEGLQRLCCRRVLEQPRLSK